MVGTGGGISGAKKTPAFVSLFERGMPMRQKFTMILLAVALAGLAAGCGNAGYAMAREQTEYGSDLKAPQPTSGAAPEEMVLTAGAFADRKVIYTGQLGMLVGDVESALVASRRIAEDLGGHMQSLGGDSIVLRVPAEKFDPAIERFSKLGIVTDRKIEARDVTEQYTDLQLRLANARALADRLREMLNQANTLEQTLAVQRELSDVTLQVEQLEGQMRAMKNRISLATIGLRFKPTSQAPEEIRTKLPFYWLDQLGLENLLQFDGKGY